MLHQQPVESHPLVRQVCKPPSQNLHLIVILPKLGVPKPFFQPETLVDDFIKLPPKPLALMAGFAQGFSLYPVWGRSCPAKGELNLFQHRGSPFHQPRLLPHCLPCPNGSRRALGWQLGPFVIG
jgi:hypothetical protein